MYTIVGKYKNTAWEELDCFDTLEECTRCLAEYRMAYGNDWIIDFETKGVKHV